MKPEQLYQQLIELAEKLSITVSEQNLRKPGIRVESGLCKVKGRSMFVMDKHAKVHKKIELLASSLGEMALDDIYMMPVVRETIQRFGGKGTL